MYEKTKKRKPRRVSAMKQTSVERPKKRKAERIIAAAAVAFTFIYVPTMTVVFGVHIIVAVLTYVILVAGANWLVRILLAW